VNVRAGAQALAEFVRRHPRLVVLTGAGCSTASGIPDYRDAAGNWKPGPPVLGAQFVRELPARQRYWARSMNGWPRFQGAQPNAAHRALASLEKRGHVRHLITQNVDGLHQRAGSRAVTELHGSLARVRCLACGVVCSRAAVQRTLERDNPGFRDLDAAPAPDGDARLEAKGLAQFRVPDCPHCGGTLKPDVVFFGESVPAQAVGTCFDALAQADALLCVGTSLMVYSGFRFCRHAAARGQPVAALNLGRTRADDMLALKVPACCDEVLTALLEELPAQPDVPKALQRSEPPSSTSTMA
jgi:NAD-dependent SIR2 family protein deacetylase